MITASHFIVTVAEQLFKYSNPLDGISHDLILSSEAMALTASAEGKKSWSAVK